MYVYIQYLAVLYSHLELKLLPLNGIKTGVIASLERGRLLMRIEARHLSNPQPLLPMISPIAVVEHRRSLQLHEVARAHVEEEEERVLVVATQVDGR